MATYWVRSLSVVLLAGSLVSFAAQADTFSPSNVSPTQYFATLGEAETAMRAVSVEAALLQFDRLSGSGIYTSRHYAVPPVAVSAPFWTDCGNTPGPDYQYASGQAVCDAARIFYNWPSYLTYTPSNISQDTMGTSLGGCRQLPFDRTFAFPGRFVTCPSGYRLTNAGSANYCPTIPGIGFGLNAICTSATTAIITVMSTCPIPHLLDKPTDACSASLEAGSGKDVYGACPCAEVIADPEGASCLTTKLALAGIPYPGPTATIRSPGYQSHLADVYGKFWRHQWLITDPVKYEACTAKRALATTEYNWHGIDYEPVGDTHNDGTAFDVPRSTSDILKKLRKDKVNEMLADLPPCTLEWGGSWPRPDWVHFQLKKPGQFRYCQ